MAATGRRISATIVDLISPKRDILTEFIAMTHYDWMQNFCNHNSEEGYFNGIYAHNWTQNFCNHRGFDNSKEGYFNGIYGRDWTQNFCNHRGFDISKERYFNGIYSHDWMQNFCNHNSKEGYFNGIYAHDWTQNFCNHHRFDNSKEGYIRLPKITSLGNFYLKYYIGLSLPKRNLRNLTLQPTTTAISVIGQIL